MLTLYKLIEGLTEGQRVYGVTGWGKRIENVSVHRERVEALIARCNSGDLAPDQLQDVIEDFVQQEAMLVE